MNAIGGSRCVASCGETDPDQCPGQVPFERLSRRLGDVENLADGQGSTALAFVPHLPMESIPCSTNLSADQ